MTVIKLAMLINKETERRIMEAEEIKKAIKEHGMGKNVSYDDKYFTHNMPEFMCIAEISFSAGENQGIQEVVEWIDSNVEMVSYLHKVWQNQKKDWGLLQALKEATDG